jgi:hypothetical protein
LKNLKTAVACLALAGMALAQTNSSSPTLEKRPAAQTSPASMAPSAGEGSSVAPDAAVITIDGLCERPPNSSATPADCKTLITRAEFEKVANVFQPNMPIATKRQLANRYAVWLYLAEKAHELGLDHGPGFDEKMAITRVQILAQIGGERVQQDMAKVSDGEVEAYYHEHIADYKTISFERLYVPKQKQMDAAGQKANDADLQAKRAASEVEMKAEADKLRARAAAGEDFSKLQQEAYDFSGMQIKASNPHVDKARKGSVPPGDAAIFELKPGDVSQVFSGPTGFVVYKVDALEEMAVASVHDEISRKLAGERQKAMMESLQNSTKLDDSYFAAPALAAPLAPPTLRNPDEAAPAAPPAPGKK